MTFGSESEGGDGDDEAVAVPERIVVVPQPAPEDDGGPATQEWHLPPVEEPELESESAPVAEEERLWPDGAEVTPAPLRSSREELDELVAQMAAAQEPPDEAVPLPEPEPAVVPPPVPERDETGPSALRPKAPEPVLAARTTSPSRARRTVSRVRALVGLVILVVLSGVVLAAATGAAIALITLVLQKAFG